MEQEDNEFLPQDEIEQDVPELIKGLEQRLASLEKKIDILINQSKPRPAGERSFSKPFRPSFGSRPPRRFDRGERPNAFGEKSFSRPSSFERRPRPEGGESSRGGSHYEKRPRPEGGEFSRGGEHRPEKRHDSHGPRSFDRKSKPFPFRRKSH